MSTPEFDLLIKNVRVVRPQGQAVHEADIAVAGICESGFSSTKNVPGRAVTTPVCIFEASWALPACGPWHFCWASIISASLSRVRT